MTMFINLLRRSVITILSVVRLYVAKDCKKYAHLLNHRFCLRRRKGGEAIIRGLTRHYHNEKKRKEKVTPVTQYWHEREPVSLVLIMGIKWHYHNLYGSTFPHQLA